MPQVKLVSAPGLMETSKPGGREQMEAQREYPLELRERATRLVVEARRDPASKVGAIKRIGDQLGVHPEALRTWVKQAEIDGGVVPGVASTPDPQQFTN